MFSNCWVLCHWACFIILPVTVGHLRPLLTFTSPLRQRLFLQVRNNQIQVERICPVAEAIKGKWSIIHIFILSIVCVWNVAVNVFMDSEASDAPPSKLKASPRWRMLHARELCRRVSSTREHLVSEYTRLVDYSGNESHLMLAFTPSTTLINSH